jgi:hypothetical protein
MAQSYLKSCCDSSVTYILNGLVSALPIGNVYYVQIPNYFTGCSEVINSTSLVPGSPTYPQAGSTLTSQSSCANCTATYPCTRITATSECDILTITPMTVQCSANTSNNSLTILVNGGTPPYKILWDNGYLGATLLGAQPTRIYTVTVTDYDWQNGGPDYTATTTCSLILPTPTPTMTPTVTPTFVPPAPTLLCLQVNSSLGNQNIQYVRTSTLVNGKFTFSSTTSTIVWDSTNNFWYTSIGSNQILQNTSNTSIPTGNWILNGAIGSGLSYTGSCSTPLMTFKTVQGTNPSCLGQNNGSIFVEVQNATTPVLYSIDGGVTESSGGLSRLFNSLASGNYSLRAEDANGTVVQQTVSITNSQTPVNYKLQVNATVTTITSSKKQINFVVSVINDLGQTTSLPQGTTVTFKLVDNFTFSVFSDTASDGNYTQNTVLKKNNVTISPSASINNIVYTSPSIGTCQPGRGIQQYISGVTKTYNGITITGSDVVSGTSVVEIFNISNAACCVKAVDYFSITQPTITGCSCCTTSTLGQSQTMTINLGTCPL